VGQLRYELGLQNESNGLPGLTAAEIERLAILGEECGEIAQAVGKVLRHGWESQSPYGGKPNRVALEREIGNVRAVVNLMLDAGDVRLGDVQAWQRSKRAALAKWTHHQACSMTREEQLEMIRSIEGERLNSGR
jgi:NTP pyrophosphatase (non-canonical NTP hydrolase)